MKTDLLGLHATALLFFAVLLLPHIAMAIFVVVRFAARSKEAIRLRMLGIAGLIAFTIGACIFALTYWCVSTYAYAGYPVDASHLEVLLQLWIGIPQWILVLIALLLIAASAKTEFERIPLFALGIALAVPVTPSIGVLMIFYIIPLLRQV